MLKQICGADKERQLFAQSRLATMGVGIRNSQTPSWLCNNSDVQRSLSERCYCQHMHKKSINLL